MNNHKKEKKIRKTSYNDDLEKYCFYTHFTQAFSISENTTIRWSVECNNSSLRLTIPFQEYISFKVHLKQNKCIATIKTKEQLLIR